MRSFIILPLSVALVTGAFVPSGTSAQDVRVTLQSSYVDTRYFNDRFSNEPQVQVEASYDLTKHVYVSAYAYSGFTKPFADNSSEYGFEVGGEWELGKVTTSLAAGRYANYQGQGFDQGDWYVKAGVTYKRVSASVSVLSGVSNTGLLNVSYTLPVTKKLTVTPSIAYFTRLGKANPAIEASYKLTDRLSVGAKCVLPVDDLTGKRKVYGAATLSYRF